MHPLHLLCLLRLQRIMAADYKMPRTISPAAQDLLQTLLVIGEGAQQLISCALGALAASFAAGLGCSCSGLEARAHPW